MQLKAINEMTPTWHNLIDFLDQITTLSEDRHRTFHVAEQAVVGSSRRLVVTELDVLKRIAESSDLLLALPIVVLEVEIRSERHFVQSRPVP